MSIEIIAGFDPLLCPRCGSANIDRIEVDIGVGIQCGPYGCFDCGWTEGETLLTPLTNLPEPPDVD
jgi:predicted RNA-binding Zn-ribbon protein involved in translation (DUF1610 family)